MSLLERIRDEPMLICPGCRMAFLAYGWHQCPTHRFGVDLDAASLRRRISTLEARLARVLRVAQGTGLSMYWTDHNGGGSVWQWRSQRRKGPAGRAWSRKRTGGRPG